MIKVTYHREKHIIKHEDCSIKSLASLILLRNDLLQQDEDYITADWRTQVEFNTRFLKFKLIEKGVLTCVYCQKTNLFINEDFNRDPPKEFLATADHVIPKVKGGAPMSYSNLVVACWTCNKNKKDKIGYKISEEVYTF